MDIICLTTDILNSNTYIVGQGKSAIVIDPSGREIIYDQIVEYLKDTSRILEAVLFTHGHFDHIALGYKFEGKTNLYIHQADSDMTNNDMNYGKLFRFDIISFEANKKLKGGEIFKAGEITVEAIHTPGHSAGSMCYVIEDNIFSGDTLFCGSVGRTDLGGSYSDLIKSIKKLLLLNGDYKIYPGHGEATTLRYEQKNNPYVKI